MTERHRCQWCGKSEKKPGEWFTALQCAAHELKCNDNPHRPPPLKDSNAWNPEPWLHEQYRKPNPATTSIIYIGGPMDGTTHDWDGFLVDGTRVTITPSPTTVGPVKRDSKGRCATKWMGYYQLHVTPDECPVYVWVNQIQKKKRLPEPRTFRESFPQLFETLPALNGDISEAVKSDTQVAAPGDLFEGLV